MTDPIFRSLEAGAKTALLMGLGAVGMNWLGLDKKITGAVAPTFIKAMKYGFVAGARTFAVHIFAENIKTANHPKMANRRYFRPIIDIGAVACLFLTTPLVANIAKSHFNANLGDRNQYLAFICESCFHLGKINITF